MRKIHLHGRLATEFAPHFELEVETAGEAIRALGSQLPGFIPALRDGAYRILRDEDDLELEELNSFRLGRGELHIVPHIAGSKDGGAALKAVLGVALVGTAFALSGGTLMAPVMFGGLNTGLAWGNVAMFGVGLALSGVSGMLAPEQKTDTANQESFSMSGPSSTTEQGAAVPLVYGEVITGGVLVSGGLDVERIS